MSLGGNSSCVHTSSSSGQKPEVDKVLLPKPHADHLRFLLFYSHTRLKVSSLGAVNLYDIKMKPRRPIVMEAQNMLSRQPAALWPISRGGETA